jgi:hypothetical protein
VDGFKRAGDGAICALFRAVFARIGTWQCGLAFSLLAVCSKTIEENTVYGFEVVVGPFLWQIYLSTAGLGQLFGFGEGSEAFQNGRYLRMQITTGRGRFGSIPGTSYLREQESEKKKIPERSTITLL